LFFFFFQIADMLPSKTAPRTKRTESQQKSTTHAKKKSRKATVASHAASPDLPAPTETMTSNTERKKKVCPLIPYYFVTYLRPYMYFESQVG
jgi:hypothetical protein